MLPFMIAYGGLKDKPAKSLSPCTCKRQDESISGCRTTLKKPGVEFWEDSQPKMLALPPVMNKDEVPTPDGLMEDVAVASMQLRYQRPIFSTGSRASRTNVKTALKACLGRLVAIMGVMQ